MIRLYFLLSFVLTNSCSASQVSSKKDVKKMVKEVIAKSNTPGIQYVAVSDQEVLVDINHGHADIKNNVSLTGTTKLMAYSMTKTFVAILTLRLYEKGILDIEKSVKDYMPKSGLRG